MQSVDENTRIFSELVSQLSEENKDLILEVLREYVASKKKRNENENEAK